MKVWQFGLWPSRCPIFHSDNGEQEFIFDIDIPPPGLKRIGSLYLDDDSANFRIEAMIASATGGSE
jgi:hypothetical protein